MKWRQIAQIFVSLNHSRQRLGDDPLPIRVKQALEENEAAAEKLRDSNKELRKVINEVLEKIDRSNRGGDVHA